MYLVPKEVHADYNHSHINKRGYEVNVVAVFSILDQRT